jgi:uncharacterized membrane protein YadS
LIERLKSAFSNLSYFVFWLVLAVLVTLSAFQLHATLTAISISIIENPSLRPTGWTFDTVHGLGRVFWLILGILWLGWVMYTEGYLREGKDNQRLIPRFVRLLLILVGIYALNYLVLLLLP